MAVGIVTAPKQGDHPQAAGQLSTKNSSLDKDAFLKLLMTQLKSQDPLQAMSDKEFMAQLAQFSQLEEMRNLNSGFQQLLGWQQVTQSAALIGKEVQVKVGGDEESVKGKVTSIKMENGTPYLMVGGKAYSLDQLEAVL
ncbi:MAG: flagellar hook capping protein [Armatimonadetes bacterium]|nr:flagellar hook capping protein [Armatimonadota bacterium]